MLLIILLSITLICYLIYYYNRSNVGVVFFDIDDTLSTMRMCDQDDIIQHCLDKGYDVGIITASDRPIDYLVNRDGTANKDKSPWMSGKLARYLHDTGFRTYNSRSLTRGIPSSFPNFRRDARMFGWKKGYQMRVAVDEFGYDPSKSYLLDDQAIVLRAANEIYTGPNYIQIDNNDHTKQLNTVLIKRLIK